MLNHPVNWLSQQPYPHVYAPPAVKETMFHPYSITLQNIRTHFWCLALKSAENIIQNHPIISVKGLRMLWGETCFPGPAPSSAKPTKESCWATQLDGSQRCPRDRFQHSWNRIRNQSVCTWENAIKFYLDLVITWLDFVALNLELSTIPTAQFSHPSNPCFNPLKTWHCWPIEKQNKMLLTHDYLRFKYLDRPKTWKHFQ